MTVDLHQIVLSILVEKGLVAQRELVFGDLRIVDSSRRNPSLKIIRAGGPCLFVKWADQPESISGLAREAAMYRLFWDHDSGRGVRRFLPRVLAQDRSLLALEVLPDSNDLRQRLARRGSLPAHINADMGMALARLHQHQRGGPGALDTTGLDGNAAHLMFHASLWCPTHEFATGISGAGVALLKLIQEHPRFGAHLSKLETEWENECLVHCDIRWDNWILARRSPSTRWRLQLVDWELSRMGDPCWDVGSVFADYLGIWLESMPVTAEVAPEQLPGLAGRPLESLWPGIRTFWSAYARHVGLDAAMEHARLAKSMRFAAVKLVQGSLELTQSAVQLTGNTIATLQLALNILERPQEAVVHLLGLPLQARRKRA